MSHLKERKEKNCLNCNAQLQGTYCHICGQENIEPKETVWHLVSHFFQDITHFDGKFFSTFKLLAIRPGFLSREYQRGRRASYLNPIRMYVFTSAFFFLIFFSFFKMNSAGIKVSTINNKNLAEIAKMDSVSFADFTRIINREANKPDRPMTRSEFNKYADSTFRNSGLTLMTRKYKTKEAYDSAISTGARKDSWLVRELFYRVYEINKKYDNNINRIVEAFKYSLLHSLPQMLFISLPLLAMLLKLLYIRRKEFYYVDHAIFSIHLYIFIFIFMLFIFAIGKLNEQLHWSALSILSVLLTFGIFFYQYKAIRNFYGQRRTKSMIKFILLNIMFLIVMLFLFVVFVFTAMFKI